jgi:DNA end-binding protein Ku
MDMLRSIWNGSLRVGLLTIPVGIAAVRVDGDVGFRTLHEPCATPVNRKWWCSHHQVVVAKDELVRGFEVAPGQFVTVTDEELAALAPTASRTIEVQAFLEPDAIDVAQVETTYYLTASESPIGRRPYALLRDVLAEYRKLGLARMVFRGNEWLVAIRPHEVRPILLLQRLACRQELVVPETLERQMGDVEVTTAERDLLTELVMGMWRRRPKPELFESEHQVRIRQLVDAKLAGGTLVEPAHAEAEPPQLPTADLAETLRSSISALRKRPARNKAKPRSQARTRKG